MNLNMHKLNLVLKKRKNYLNQQYQPFGSALKQKRKEKSMTLVEACKNICSISYFSKVENNQIIPSYTKKMLLQERFHIPEQFLNESLFEEEIQLWIDFLLYGKREDKDKLMRIRFEENHYGWMHQYLYDIHIENKTSSIQSLYDYFDRYNDEALFVLLYTFARVVYQQRFYQQAYDILSVIDLNQYENDKIKFLYEEIMMKTSFYCHKTFYFTDSVKRVEQLGLALEKYDVIKDAKKRMIAYQAIYQKHSNLSEIDHEYMGHVIYAKDLKIDDVNVLPIEEVTLMIMFRQQHPKLSEKILKFNQPDHILTKWLNTHLENNREKMLEFLRNMLHQEVLSKYGFEVLHFIYTQSSMYFEQSNFYKEASQLNKKGFMILNQIRIA
jgi:transcriptional regulator with XRE-family HTH domain